MDLQLYRIDDQNYLVDFRNLGYRSIKPSSPSISPTSTVLSTPATNNDLALPNTADELRSRNPDLAGAVMAASPVPSTRIGTPLNGGGGGGGAGCKKAVGTEVSSPYLFLECAVRLIVELASPAGGDA